jgi:hypothetical protein
MICPLPLNSRFGPVILKILNTLTNAYERKFSSGLLLALLAISGILVLVPIASPAFATNSSLPSVTSIIPNPAKGGAITSISISISNPASNSYAITGFDILAPSGVTLGFGCGAGGYLIHCADTATGATFTTTNQQTGQGIPPKDSDGVSFRADIAAAATYPFNLVFQTEVQDASGTGYYTGPTFTVQVVDPSTSIAITSVTPGGSNTATSYTAGTAPYTVTATVSTTDAISEAGLTINWYDFGNGASGPYPSSFSALSSTTVSATANTATATITYQPSDDANAAHNTGSLVAGIGTYLNSAAATAITTKAGAPSGVTVSAGGSSTATDYITATGTPSYPHAVLSGTVAIGGITGVLTDAYSNPVTSGITGETCTVLAFGGTFDNAGVSTTTDSIAAGASCSAAGAIANTLAYYQGLTYGTTAYSQVSMTGMYGGSSFTAVGNSQTLSTSSIDAALNAITVTCAACTALVVAAGSSAGVVSTISLSYTLTTNQLNVPVTFLGVNTSSPYTGSFVGGNGPSFHPVGNPAGIQYANVTVRTVENTAGTAAIATATFTIDPTVTPASTVEFEVEFAHPLTGAPTTIVGPGSATSVYTTGPGTPSKLSVDAFFTAPNTNPTTKSVTGQNVYLDVYLVDYWGNAVTCTATSCGGQLQIALAASPASAGTFSATSVYIAQGKSDTLNSFGTITFAVSATAALGVVTISGTGFYSGSGMLTLVSPNPTITVNSPVGTVGHVVYSGFNGVGFSGTSAASLGYVPATVTISSVTYSVDGAAAVTASGTTSWTAVPTMANGLHTVTFTVTDSNMNTASNTTSVLVDTTGPVITGPTTLAYGAGTPVVFSVVDAEGDLNAASVVATSNSSATLTTTVTGTNNPGSSVTYTVSVSGLPATTGHWSLTLNAKSLTGVAAHAVTVVVAVTVAQAQSLVISGTPTSSTVNGYTGVSATYQNVWSSSQSVIVFAVWKNSIDQTVYVSAGAATLAAGGSQSFFLPELGLAAGTYTVNVSVWTTSNTPVSVQTTVTVTVS